MIRPSQLRDVEFLKQVPRAKIHEYLIVHGWDHVFTSEHMKRNWYFHKNEPIFSSGQLFDEGYDTAYIIPNELLRTIEKPQFLVSTVPENFIDYARNVGMILNDLEMHEDRWRGQILEDILAL